MVAFTLDLKDFFKKYGILCAVFAVLLGFVIYFVKISQKSWNKNLKTSIENVLIETGNDVWDLGAPVDIKTPFSLSTSAFYARNRKSGENSIILISRVQSFYGPVTGVFISDLFGRVRFIGYSSVHGIIANQLNESFVNKRLEYFSERIPSILDI